MPHWFSIKEKTFHPPNIKSIPKQRKKSIYPPTLLFKALNLRRQGSGSFLQMLRIAGKKTNKKSMIGLL